jgi:uncharacterized protein
MVKADDCSDDCSAEFDSSLRVAQGVRVTWLTLVVGILFALLGLGAVATTLIGLPGAWLLIALAVLVEIFLPIFGWGAIGIAAALALAGEIVETLAGAAGTRAGGGTSRGMVGAILGGLVGGIAFTGLLPIPIVGTLVGAAVGTFAGAALGEMTGERAPDVGGTVRAATGATIGRLAGTMGKTILACAAWVLLTLRAFVA